MLRALNLVGGGAKGIIQAGMLQRIDEIKMPVDLIYGTSAGALNAAMFSQRDIQRMLDLWLTITNKDVKRLAPWKMFTDACIYDNAPLLATLQKHVQPGLMRIPTRVTLTDTFANAAKHVRIDCDPRCVINLLATTAIPGLFPKVNNCFDGGVTDNYNIRAACDAGVDEIVVLHPSRPAPFKGKTLTELLGWAYELTSWSNYVHEMEGMGLHHSANEQRVLVYKKPPVITDSKTPEPLIPENMHTVRVRVCIPTEPINVPLFDFEYKGQDRKAIIKQGYDLAVKLIG